MFADCFYENSVHPTGAGMALVANYMANQIDAPTTVVSQGAIATALATNFTGSVFGRLDAYRTFDEFAMGAASATVSAAPSKSSATAAPENRWSVYGGANDSGGGGEQQFLAPGYNYNAAGGDLGLEYRVDPRLRLGAVFGYAAPEVNLNVQNAHDHIDSYQFAGYASFTDKNWFADVLIRLWSRRVRARSPRRDRRHSRRHRRRRLHGRRTGRLSRRRRARSAPDRSPASTTPTPSFTPTPKPATAC